MANLDLAEDKLELLEILTGVFDLDTTVDLSSLSNLFMTIFFSGLLVCSTTMLAEDLEIVFSSKLKDSFLARKELTKINKHKIYIR